MKLRRRNHGTIIIETVCSLIVLVFVGLIFIDLISIALCVQSNDSLAQSAARAAARTLAPSGNFGLRVTGEGAPTKLPGNVNAPTTVQNTPEEIAHQVVHGIARTAIVKETAMSFFCEHAPYYFVRNFREGPTPPNHMTVGAPPYGMVTVVSAMTMRFPIPMPFFEEIVLFSRGTEQVTSDFFVTDTQDAQKDTDELN
jgi:hypothetical protein